MHLRAAVETLGCKVNQYESSFFQERLEDAGFRIVSFKERADLYLVHGCAVTSRACYQTRQLLRRAVRTNPDARIVAAGCSAQLEGDRYAAEGIASHVLGTVDKYHLLQWLEKPADLNRPLVARSDPRRSPPLRPLTIGRMLDRRSRAFLKVQDGCNAFCTYCIVPWTRGRSRSLPLNDAVGQLRRFVSEGYGEVVLSGIHLGQWGRDLHPPGTLPGLLRACMDAAGGARLRLSSLEPHEWTDELLNVLGDSPGVCPHFHVPLQSGDPKILEAMGRPYTPDEYAALVLELRRRFPDAAIGADVLVGFPGESEARFRNTLELIERLPLTYLHVFPFSPRPGTPAAGFRDRPHGAAVKRRAEVLRNLGREKRRRFEAGFVGSRVEVLVESEASPGWLRGTSENYLSVRFAAAAAPPTGARVGVRVERTGQQGLIGVID